MNPFRMRLTSDTAALPEPAGAKWQQQLGGQIPSGALFTPHGPLHLNPRPRFRALAPGTDRGRFAHAGKSVKPTASLRRFSRPRAAQPIHPGRDSRSFRMPGLAPTYRKQCESGRILCACGCCCPNARNVALSLVVNTDRAETRVTLVRCRRREPARCQVSAFFQIAGYTAFRLFRGIVFRRVLLPRRHYQ